MFKPLDLFWGLSVQDTRRSVDLNICFWFDKLSPVTHCAVSSFLSVITAASQAELSCHICHLWWMTSVPSKEELRNRSHRRHRATQILLDKVDWRVFVPRTFYFFFCRLLRDDVLFGCMFDATCWIAAVTLIQSVYVCVPSFFVLTALWFLSISSNFLICLCCHFSWHFSMSHLLISLKCTIWIALGMTVQHLQTEKQCRIVLFCKSYLSASFNCL